MERHCEGCGGVIPWLPTDWPARYAKKRFCSLLCANRSRPINPTTTRYRSRKVNGKPKPVHRIVMEEKLGRPLRPDEVVHHLNEDKLDNRPENLVVTTAREHGLEHHPPSHPVVKVCGGCGATFRPHKTKRKRQQTCGDPGCRPHRRRSA